MPAILSRPSAFSLFTVVLFVFSQGPANAAICNPATADGAGLQACLDSSAPGDTILLQPGTYVPTTPLAFPPPQGNTFFIGKHLTITGAGPGVVLSGDLGGGLKVLNVVVIDASANPGPVSLENLSIEDGDSTGGGFFVGAGIVAGDGQTVALSNVAVRDNLAVNGGGIWTGSNSTWLISDSKFIANTANNFGGAVAMFCVSCGGNNSWSIYNSKFIGNSATNFGGAVDIFVIDENTTPSVYSIVDSSFRNNSTSLSGVRGGAISAAVSRLVAPLAEPVRGEITNSTFKDNSSVIGGAVHIDGGAVELTGNTFNRNFASQSGGGLYMGFTLDGYSLESNWFKQNSSYNGGAIFNTAIVTRMIDTKFEKNCAEGDGGALYNTTDPGLNNPDIQLTGVIQLIGDAKFTHNHADRGGAIANITNPGSIAPQMANINEIRNTKIKNNSANTAGPAIYDPDMGVLFLNDVELKGNEIGGKCKPGTEDDDSDDE